MSSLKDRKEAVKIFLTPYHISVMAVDTLLRVFQVMFMRLGVKPSFSLFSLFFCVFFHCRKWRECVKENERRIKKLKNGSK